jgi:hypothetical protein
MSNVDTVKSVISKLPSRFTTKQAHSLTEGLTPEQTGKALRGVKYVKSLGGGRYQVKGRKVS